MRLFAKRYYVNGWHNRGYFLTAKQLYERVMQDSKSDYNWIVSATELVAICRRKGFPEEYAKGIKVAILNCFARLETRKEYEKSYGLSSDNDAVHYCYNSLDYSDEDVTKAKHNYLRAVIRGITLYHFEIPIYVGKMYSKVCAEWREAKFKEYIEKERIDFDVMVKRLDEEFGNVIETAKRNGVFEEDEREEMEIYKKIIQHFCGPVTDELVN